MTIRAFAVCFLVAAAGCSDGSTDSSRTQQRIEELITEIRQNRAEIQRSNERVIALLQQHGLQNTALPLPSSSADVNAPDGRNSNMEASRALSQAHATMSERMSAVPLTGDPDRDFLAQMIPHHEGAIDMSKILLQGGLRPEVRRLAQEIIAHQQGEIVLMRRWLEALGK